MKKKIRDEWRYWDLPDGRKTILEKGEIQKFLNEFVPPELILPKEFEEANQLTIGKCFKVDLSQMNLGYFLENVETDEEERAMSLMRVALIDALRDPEKYSKFYVLVPKKEWVYGKETWKKVEQLELFAEKVNGFVSNHITEILIWAQRHANGESLKKLCEEKDTLECRRFAVWYDGLRREIGGNQKNTPVTISKQGYSSQKGVSEIVPTIILKTLDCPKGVFFG